ncbi:caspase family protein [Novipirellula artificiosorum]|uniref:Caspase domain protein n=1 Tax=Novipirellula artificiosorum TaxID=2528016 RepID=A0A5C6DU86_9BACT|nr:hypothetical protein [Novipirellula artificiosorum]TWU40933.1 hypothetical protein Poly41_17680 [Novipirellula artificiosorum]
MARLLFPFFLLVWILVFAGPSNLDARDFFLTIGGGFSPSGNQASLEKNVLLFRRTMEKQQMEPFRDDTFFSDGDNPQPDLQVIDAESIPRSNRLMAEFFGSQQDLGLSYRNHELANVRGPSKPDPIRRWFNAIKGQIGPGDRLMIYVTAHGQRSRQRERSYNTSIAMWDNSSLQMQEFATLLDDLPDEISVVMVMVQCYTGGFSHVMFRGGDPEKGLSPQRRVGFYATVHDRPAAGCTAEADETNYAEYSTYFWAAMSGVDRANQPIERPDYDDDGKVSFEEAHAYTILMADTIDLPVKTSGEYLAVVSRFAADDDDNTSLLKNDEPYRVVLQYASPVQRRVLDDLSKQLGLEGDNRLVDAWRASRPQRRRGRGRPESEAEQIRKRIASGVRTRWPELANVMNPKSIELVTTLQDRFVGAIEQHPEYSRYLELKSREESSPDEQYLRVKHERLLRVADNVLLAENLRRLDQPKELANYLAIVAAEREAL